MFASVLLTRPRAPGYDTRVLGLGRSGKNPPDALRQPRISPRTRSRVHRPGPQFSHPRYSAGEAAITTPQ